MITQEYYSVSQLSKLNDMTARNVRKIIAGLQSEKNESLVYKDANNTWRVHHLLLHFFKRKRTKNNKHYAITIDPVETYSIEEIVERLSQVMKTVDNSNFELKVTIEPKLANGRNHIHGYFNTSNKKTLMNGLKFWFPSMSYHLSEAYDLDGWISYMTKSGAEIITVSKNEGNERI